MPYTKTVWDETVGVSPARLNNLETQHEKAVADSLPRSGGNLTGNLTILGQQAVHAGNIAAYAPSPANYDDRKEQVIINVGAGQPYATIQAAINSLKKVNAGERVIFVAPGHVEPAAITVTGFHGGGIVIAVQNSGTMSVPGTVDVNANTAKITLHDMILTGAQAHFNCQNNIGGMYMYNCQNTATSNYGMWAINGGVYTISFCQFSNHAAEALQVGTGVLAVLENVTGTGNGTGINASAGIVMKNTGSTITGTTPQSKSGGGQIF